MEHSKFRSLLLLGLLIVLVAWTGCRPKTLPENANPENWIKTDPVGCIGHYNARFESNIDSSGCEMLLDAYTRILRHFPEKPIGNPDSVIEYTGRMLKHYSFLFRYISTHGSYHLTDSLLHSSHPFLTTRMRPELLATSSRLHMLGTWEGDPATGAEHVDSLVNLLLQMPPIEPIEREIRIFNIAARSLYFVSSDHSTYIALQKRAVDALLQARHIPPTENCEVIANLGEYYYLNNEYEKGVDALQEAISWNLAHPECNNKGLAVAYRNLATLYTLLELHHEALHINAKAIGLAGPDSLSLTDYYRVRGFLYAAVDKPDSAMLYYDKAIDIFHQYNDSSSSNFVLTTKHGTFLTAYPDSSRHILDEAAHLYYDFPRIQPRNFNLRRYQYGQALYNSGQPAKGLPLMEESYREAIKLQVPEQVVGIARTLMQCYIEQGQESKVGTIYRDYAPMHDSLQNDQKARAVVAANVRYETGRKEQENRVLTTQVELKQRNLALVWSLAGLLFLVLTGSFVYFRQRQRYQRRVSEARLAQITHLLDMQQQLKEHNKELAEAMRKQEEKQKRAAMKEVAAVKEATEVQDAAPAQQDAEESAEKGEPLSAEAICYHLRTGNFDANAATNFRRSFQALYPQYLPALHKLAADLTRTDELIAMLVYLGFANDEIALTLNIAHSSVHKARSRMRKRLGLEQGANMEEFLKKL